MIPKSLFASAFSGALLFSLAAEASTQKPLSAEAKRGQQLVATHGCHDCHTPLKMGQKGPEPDLTRALSGHPQELVMPPAPQLPKGPWMWVGSATNTAFAGPWGVSFASNLTADTETGMGKWKPEEFVAAIKTGKHLGVSRPIMPPMPWESYRHLSEKDLKAIFVYLQSVPAIRNQVPAYLPPSQPAAKP
jgi:mono/diheme cytochrome c family protein